MAKHMTLALCVLLVVIAALVPQPGRAADRYEVVAEYNGPYFRVTNGGDIDQLVDDPLHEFAFQNVYGIAVSREAGGRIMNYVLDSGNRRILGFESQMDIGRLNSTGGAWTDPRTAAGEWDDQGINLPEWVGAAAQWVIPYSEVFKVNGETWEFVADLTGYASSDHVYTLDYDDPSNAPELQVVTGALAEEDAWEVIYAITDYQGAATAAFGLGDIDQGNSDGASVTVVRIDQAAPVSKSFQDLRALFAIDNQTTATTDELWLVDADDSSVGQNEELMVYTVTQGTAVEAFLEAYDDVLVEPSDVYVAKTAGDTYTAPTTTAAAGVPHFTAISVVDESQVTGHTYAIAMSGSDVTITDLTTGRVLIEDGAKGDFVTGTSTCYIIPGIAVDFTVLVADDTPATFTTNRAIPSRYAFVCDRGNDRIKVVGVPDISTTTGDDLPGDPHTCAAQPTGAGTIGLTQDQDYRFSTPAAVPENWKTGTVARPIKEGSLESMTADPDGTPVVWTRIDDLATAGPTDQVFQLDWWEGVILFGDGVHGQLPPASTDWELTYTTTPDVLRYGATGSGAGQFLNPEAVCGAWNAGLACYVVYVADTGNNRVQKLHFYPEDAALNTPPRMEYICSWSTATDVSDPLVAPHDLDVVQKGTGARFVGVADMNDRVVLYEDTAFLTRGTNAPTFATLIGSNGTRTGTFSDISAVDLIANGTEIEAYIADGQRDVVAKFVMAPEPTITMYFTGNSLLPRSFPPTASYPFSFSVANGPAGAYVDFYYSDAAVFDGGTAHLCFSSPVVANVSPVIWSFDESPDGTPADGTYYLHARLYDGDDNLLATDQTNVTERLTISSKLVTALCARDRFDGDATLLIAPHQTRAISLELSYPEDAIGASFVGTFPPDMVEIVSIVPGSGWEGTDYIQHVWNASFDNEAGTYAVFTSVTGAPVGLSTPGSHAMAYINVRPVGTSPLAGEQRSRNGGFALDPASSRISSTEGELTSGYLTRNMAVKMAYVGDIAHASTGCDSMVPYLQPNPDGYMTFADQMAFTLAWNGESHIQDPIADMGPVTGAAPELIPTPDGRWDLEDLIAFTSNWSWFGANGYSITAGNETGARTAFSPLGTALDGSTEIALSGPAEQPLPGETMTVTVDVREAQQLTGAMVRVTYDPAELSLIGLERGTLLGAQEATVLFNTIEREGTCELCLTRLHLDQPGVDGDGTLAELSFRVVAPPQHGVGYAYDLRDRHDEVLARGSGEVFQSSTPLSRVVLCQNYPNPLKPSTSIVFTLPERETVDLAVYDLSGRRVRTLVAGPRDPGAHAIDWDGRGDEGQILGSGIYFYRLRAGDELQTRKLVIAR